MEKVEKIQYQAALAITGAWQGSSRSKMYDELGWETLSDRRNCRRVLQIHKIINNNTISYLKDKLPANCKEMFSGIIRNTFHAIMCKSNRYKNSFFPNAVASWNLFMENFNYKVAPSIGVLKNDIISLIRPAAKSVFKIHDPAGLRYLFQLRVGLSPLKGHKWCHNFIDTPSGVCHCNQGIEDTSHFLLSCPSHVIQRETLMSSVNEILLKANKNHLESQLQLYLYGDTSLNNFDNKNIILSTIKFTHPPPLLFCFNLNCFCNFICMCVLCYTFFLFIRVVVCNFLGWTWLWLNSFATPRPCNYSLERKSIYKKLKKCIYICISSKEMHIL